jgi:hypothetical protein
MRHVMLFVSIVVALVAAKVAIGSTQDNKYHTI